MMNHLKPQISVKRVYEQDCLRQTQVFGAKTMFCPEAQSDRVGLKQEHNGPG